MGFPPANFDGIRLLPATDAVKTMFVEGKRGVEDFVHAVKIPRSSRF
jgi:hypothetical protein